MNLRAIAAATLFAAACAAPEPAQTPPQAARAVAESLFAAFNRHDVEALAALYAPDAVLTSPDYCQPLHGPEQVASVYRSLFEAVPDVQDEDQHYVVEGDRVAVSFVARSRTPGREFELPIASFLEVRDGLIVRDRSFFDLGGQPCR